MAKIASRTRAPFLAAASPRLAGLLLVGSTPHPREWNSPDPELMRAWAELRHLPEAELRRAGASAVPTASALRKENLSDRVVRIRGVPRCATCTRTICGAIQLFAVALLLGQSFSEAGWEMRPGTAMEIDQLPLHVYLQGWRIRGQAMRRGAADRRGGRAHVGGRPDAPGFVQGPRSGPAGEISVDCRPARARWPAGGTINRAQSSRPLSEGVESSEYRVPP